ncbi:MAG: stage sporulation protein cell division protein FtsW [Candidatus Parcubacteria bacterium]|jgi:cell division protein FtsW
MMRAKASKVGHRPDYFFLVLVCVLTVMGLVILASASSYLGQSKFNDSYYYLKHQLTNGLLPGMLGFAIATFFHYQRYRKFALFILLANLCLLVLVFIPSFGVAAGGANRWVSIGPVSFQPAEFLKVSYILYLAAWLASPRMNRTRDLMSGLVPFIVISGVVAALLLAQPATSIVVILLGAGTVMYILSGAPWKHIAVLMGVGCAAIAFILLLSATGIISKYRWQRIQTFLNPTQDTQGAAYQINQAVTTIGSGQFAGIGYGQSTAKVNRLPAPIDDSIFAIAAQELGFAGASAIVALFALLVYRLLWLAGRVRDPFGATALTGFAIIIALQSIVNMGAISGLIPLTGIPLPFISYGGTALAVFLTMSGIAVNISRYT